MCHGGGGSPRQNIGRGEWVVTSYYYIWIWISRCGRGGGKAVGVSAEVEETIIKYVYSFLTEERPAGGRATPQKLSI